MIKKTLKLTKQLIFSKKYSMRTSLVTLTIATILGGCGAAEHLADDLSPMEDKGLLVVTTNAPSGAFVLYHRAQGGRYTEMDSYPPEGGCQPVGCPTSWGLNLDEGIYSVNPLDEVGLVTPIPQVVEVRTGERHEVSLIYKKRE